MITTKINSLNEELLKKYFDNYCNKVYGKLFPLTDKNIINYINDCSDYYYSNKDIRFSRPSDIYITEKSMRIVFYPIDKCYMETYIIQHEQLLPIKMLNRYDKFLDKHDNFYKRQC